MIGSTGWRVQPVSPASAMDPPISERKRRRLALEMTTPVHQTPLGSPERAQSCVATDCGIPHAFALRSSMLRAEQISAWCCRSSVTDLTACEFPGTPDSILPDKPLAQLRLIRWVSISHRKDLVARAYVILNMTMTI